jgi:hypothetical protein
MRGNPYRPRITRPSGAVLTSSLPRTGRARATGGHPQACCGQVQVRLRKGQVPGLALTVSLKPRSVGSGGSIGPVANGVGSIPPGTSLGPPSKHIASLRQRTLEIYSQAIRALKDYAAKIGLSSRY